MNDSYQNQRTRSSFKEELVRGIAFVIIGFLLGILFSFRNLADRPKLEHTMEISR